MADQMRFATFFVGQEGLKLTITRLGKEAAAILANVNRWRNNDLNLQPIAEADLPTVTRSVTVDNHPVTLVDMTGSATPLPPPQEEPDEPAGGATGQPQYDVPSGWQPIPATGFRKAAFKVTEGGQSAEVTVIPLGGQAGGVIPNINRWRREVGLADVTDDQLDPSWANVIQTKAGKVLYVDLVGAKERTLGAVLRQPGTTWFYKLRGPADLVGKHHLAFEGFVKSLRFGAK
jgi:hypothetical protein